jgi:hypothetical protein
VFEAAGAVGGETLAASAAIASCLFKAPFCAAAASSVATSLARVAAATRTENETVYIDCRRRRRDATALKATMSSVLEIDESVATSAALMTPSSGVAVSKPS